MTVGQRIKKTRSNIGMSQTDFAEAIGVSKQTLYKYENDIITNIPSDKIEAVARVGNVSPEYLMGWNVDSYYASKYLQTLAAALNDNEKMQILFEAAQNSRPEDIELAANMLERMKAYNNKLKELTEEKGGN